MYVYIHVLIHMFMYLYIYVLDQAPSNEFCWPSWLFVKLLFTDGIRTAGICIYIYIYILRCLARRRHAVGLVG